MTSAYRKIAPIESDRDIWYGVDSDDCVVVLKGSRPNAPVDTLYHELTAIVMTHDAMQRRTGQSRSPLVVKELDFTELDGKNYLVLEDAGERCIRDIADESSSLFHALADVSDALAHIHFANLRYYDMKPSNVLLDENACVRLIDLGSCAPREWRDLKTNQGTPGYASPRLLTGLGDARADTFGLGATTFELLTGATLYGSGTSVLRDIYDGQRGKFRPWPIIPGVTRSTFSVLKASTAFRTEDRPSLRELGDALRVAAIEYVARPMRCTF